MARREHRCLYALAPMLLGAGCLSIAGLDGDFVLGETGAGGAGTTTGAGASTGASGGGNATTSATSTSTVGGSGGGPTTTSSNMGGGGGGTVCVGTHEFIAEVADCIDVTAPNPDTCEAFWGPGEMTISIMSNPPPYTPIHSFLRFDLSPVVAQSPLASVTLELVVPSTQYADSTNSGEVWQVEPFVRADLFVGRPNNVGTVALAGTQGPVTFLQTVSWPLPTNVVMGGSVYLELRPLVSNHADYFNVNGTTPPKLIVTCP